ncbi:MAG: hypothetical protein U1U88_001502 [Lawsonella clevelandensis]
MRSCASGPSITMAVGSARGSVTPATTAWNRSAAFSENAGGVAKWLEPKPAEPEAYRRRSIARSGMALPNL